jgi:hypothetical protein
MAGNFIAFRRRFPQRAADNQAECALLSPDLTEAIPLEYNLASGGVMGENPGARRSQRPPFRKV